MWSTRDWILFATAMVVGTIMFAVVYYVCSSPFRDFETRCDDLGGFVVEYGGGTTTCLSSDQKILEVMR